MTWGESTCFGPNLKSSIWWFHNNTINDARSHCGDTKYSQNAVRTIRSETLPCQLTTWWQHRVFSRRAAAPPSMLISLRRVGSCQVNAEEKKDSFLDIKTGSCDSASRCCNLNWRTQIPWKKRVLQSFSVSSGLKDKKDELRVLVWGQREWTWFKDLWLKRRECDH